MRKVKGRDQCGGFSLLELTCALFIITTGIFGAIQMYMVAMDKIQVMNENTLAQAVLQNEIEALRARAFDDLSEEADQPFLSATPALERLPDALGTVTIQPAAAATPGLKQVQVCLRWRSGHGWWIEKSLTTLIADKGVGNGQK